MANDFWTLGIEHGWIARPIRAEHDDHRIPRRHRFTLSDWLPASMLTHRATVTRDEERAVPGLRAARDARESGR
ncbi:hypothetical protein [Leifsonia poae]|uniref:hypothetical protein n=1 Tax=Leifsonia poae TaxID=110933 RepID=UPI001CC059C0|nr:hypothetical protein [Leifsonia poae]